MTEPIKLICFIHEIIWYYKLCINSYIVKSNYILQLIHHSLIFITNFFSLICWMLYIHFVKYALIITSGHLISNDLIFIRTSISRQLHMGSASIGIKWISIKLYQKLLVCHLLHVTIYTIISIVRLVNEIKSQSNYDWINCSSAFIWVINLFREWQCWPNVGPILINQGIQTHSYKRNPFY